MGPEEKVVKILKRFNAEVHLSCRRRKRGEEGECSVGAGLPDPALDSSRTEPGQDGKGVNGGAPARSYMKQGRRVSRSREVSMH